MRPGPCLPGENAGRFGREFAFTTIELIGVLTVLTLLAAAVLPNVIRRIDHAAWTKETSDLTVLADCYTQYILRNKTVPNLATWAASVASQISLPVNAVTNTPRSIPRVFLIDPNMKIGPNAGSNLSASPYIQDANGGTNPANARVMFLSSLSSALPIGALDFNDIWNTPEGAKPSTWGIWQGKGDDLRIKRLNLGSLFHRLILIDHDNLGAAKFSIDSTNVMTVPTNGLGWSSYYLDGTVLDLRDSANVVQARYLINRDISFVFEANNWRGQIQGGQNYDASGDDFAAEASQFFATRWNGSAGQGSTQQSVLVAMYSFMFNYTLWATECPTNFSRHGTTGSPSSLPEYDMLSAAGDINGFLDKYSDDNTGLLK